MNSFRFGILGYLLKKKYMSHLCSLKQKATLFAYRNSHFAKYRAASFLVFHLSVFLVHPIPQQAYAKLIRAQSLYQ